MAKLDKGAASEDVSRLKVLVAERNKTLTELYCVSRLHEFLNITNENTLPSDIQKFLDANDIQKGHRFDPNTLPKFTQIEPCMEKKTAKSKSSTPVDSTKKDKDSLKYERDDRKIDAREKGPIREAKFKHLKDAKLKDTIVQESPSKADGIEIELENISNDADQSRMAGKRTRKEEPVEPSESRDSSMAHENGTSSPSEVARQGHIKRQKTSSTDTDQQRNPPVSKRRQTCSLITELASKPMETKQLYLQDNINAKESIFMIMKDRVPSKIPQAVPLSELKYNAHTLPPVSYTHLDVYKRQG